jgi:hypothetical protein
MVGVQQARRHKRAARELGASDAGPLLCSPPSTVMRARNALVLSLSLALGAHAFELPFQVPFFAHNKHGKAAPASAADTARRVAIIGAGAGGSSAAFWIGKAKERYGLDIEVDVYERADYIGGRECFTSCTIDAALTVRCR